MSNMPLYDLSIASIRAAVFHDLFNLTEIMDIIHRHVNGRIGDPRDRRINPSNMAIFVEYRRNMFHIGRPDLYMMPSKHQQEFLPVDDLDIVSGRIFKIRYHAGELIVPAGHDIVITRFRFFYRLVDNFRVNQRIVCCQPHDKAGVKSPENIKELEERELLMAES